MTAGAPGLDRRLVFLAATSRDAAMTEAMLLPQGIQLTTCRTFDELLGEVALGAGAVLLPEEAASSAHNAALRAALASQPPWSDLPILVLTRQGADSAESGDAVRTLGNVMLLERPVRLTTLVTAIRTALRARDRQYQMRQHLQERLRAEDALRVADRRKDEFLATLGHELRNPLAPLLTALQLLKVGAPVDPAVARATAVMERQLHHLVRLVNDLLEVSRITRGLIEVQREPVDLAYVMHSAIDTSRPLIDAAGHALSLDLPAEPVVVYGDPVRLTQVFANLLTNAAKYTNAGGHIWVRVRQAGGTAVVSVRDDGIGIAADQLASVFEMFTQVDRSARLAQGGLGIGLTLVRTLVTMHGGRVQARSRGPGRGSEFVVELPAVAARALDPGPATKVDGIAAQRILIVDDNQDSADTLGALLGRLGGIVSVVYNGRDALAALATFEPNVMILDIGMPEMDGYEVARQVRSMPAHADVLLIALTGWGQDHDRESARAAGFDHHMVKPPDIPALRDVLNARRGTLTGSV
jgi:signal transduction histidine kinase/ActR/RegA family two-component response regulator